MFQLKHSARTQTPRRQPSTTVPTAIQRALRARDGHCQYPGCTHSRYVDGHHIVHWSAGGETKLDNLILLCRRHHRYLHEFGYVVERSESGVQLIQHPT